MLGTHIRKSKSTLPEVQAHLTWELYFYGNYEDSFLL